MTITLYLVLFVGFLFIVVNSGTLLVRSLVNISHYLRLSEYVLAFIIMAFATSVPELFVGISSAISHKPVLSLGNIIGANMVNATLAIGLVIIIARGIKLNDATPKKDAWITFFLSLLPLLLVYDGLLSRIDGIILLSFFVWYITRLLSRRQEFDAKLNSVKPDLKVFRLFLGSIGLFFLGLILLLIGAWGAVWSATNIAEILNISLLSIGLVLVALGTTLPEIVFGIRSVMLRHESMTVGNFIGSIAFNSLFVLGIVALISPIEVTNMELVKISGLILILALLVFNLFIRSRDRLSYKEGFIMIALYVFFLSMQTLLS